MFIHHIAYLGSIFRLLAGGKAPFSDGNASSNFLFPIFSAGL
jgi:hypothetical protein